MQPRKKDITAYIMPILGIIAALFLALHMAISYDNVKDNTVAYNTTDSNGNVVQNNTFDITAFFSDLGQRLTEEPGNVKWTQSTPKFLGIGLFACLMIWGYVSTSQKKFINNKEYGTSEWGNKKQIYHLLAQSVKKNQIKDIKKNKKLNLKEKKEAIAQAKLKYKDNSNIIFTQTEKICMYNYELNNNTMIIGGSGSGKTRGYVLPNILQCCNSPFSPSIVCTDPKGEILSKIGKYLEDCGYVIKVMNLKEQNKSFGFNPFYYISDERYEEQISSLVSSIMDSRSEDKEKKGNDPFWDDMAKVLLKSLFYATYEGFPLEERNMATVMELFRWFEISDNDDRHNSPTKLDRFFTIFGDKDGTLKVAEAISQFYDTYYKDFFPLTHIQTCLPTKLNEIREKIKIEIYSDDIAGIDSYKKEINSFFEAIKDLHINTDEIAAIFEFTIAEIDKYVKDRCSNYDGNSDKPIGVCLYEKYGDINRNPALRNWEDFRTKCKGKTAQSVTATALAKLAPFDEEQIRRIFLKDEMELDLVGERKTALFIVLPPTNKTYNFIANVLYTQLFEQLEYCATVKHNQTLPVSVRMILDEFYNTGKIPNFEHILSYARSFGIGISIILQSLDQIKEMYEKSWGTVLDNCSTFLYLGGIRHYDTLKYVSDLLGKGTFDKKTYSRTKGRQSSSSTNFDKIGRELLDPSEIQRMDKKKCLLFVSGYQPYISTKFNYKTHPNYKFTSDHNKKNIYNYTLPSSEKRVETPIVNLPTHGEKNETGETSPISLNTDQDEILEFLNNNVLNLDLESGEEVKLADDEIDELRMLQEILEEEKAENQKIHSIMENITTSPIELKLSTTDILQTVEEMEKNKDKIDIDNQEIFAHESKEIEEGWEDEDDIEIDLDNIEIALNDLEEDMGKNGFLSELNSLDISTLPDGEKIEDKEESINEIA